MNIWKKNLRLTRNHFFDWANKLQPYISPKLLLLNHGTSNVDQKKLALTLYYLNDTGSLIITANNFGGAITPARSVIYEVCSAIYQNLEPQKSIARLPI